MLLARTAPMWRPQAPRIVTAASGGGGPEPSDFIPADADWWFDAATVPDVTIAEWNTTARSLSYPGADNGYVTLPWLSAGKQMGLKNSCVKPTLIASGPNKGCIRQRRGGEQPDPFGPGTDIADWGGNQAAHNFVFFSWQSGNLPLAPTYGQRIEFGAEIMFPLNDGLLTEWDGDDDWAAGYGPGHRDVHSTESPTWFFLHTYHNTDPAPRRFIAKSGWLDNAGLEVDRYWKPGVPSPGHAPPQGSFGYTPWVGGVWYKLKTIFINTSTADGWCDYFLQNMSYPYTTIRNQILGGIRENKPESIRIGVYKDYRKITGPGRVHYTRRVYVKIGGSTTAPTW